MKGHFLYFFLLSFLFTSCKKDWSIPVSSCTLNFPDSSKRNPKDSLYQALLQTYVGRGIPGIVLLVKTPKEGLWISSAGQSKIETGEPMLPCHIHHSGSVAKMYIGTAVMLLVEDGKIILDEPINKYLDAGLCNRIGNGNLATVRQLLNHTSGIPDFIAEERHLTDYFNNLFNHYTTDDFLRYIYDKDADFKPGEKVEYCNTNFVLLSLIIDNVNGQPHANFLTERIFKKVGLSHTYYKNEAGYPGPDGVVNSYFDRYGNGKLENITKAAIHFNTLTVGHDAMLATAHDYAKFMEALVKGKIVSPSSLVDMQKWNYDPVENNYTGLAIIKEETKYGDAIGHGGTNLGVAMMVRYYPKSDIIIVYCSNFSGYFSSPISDVFGTFTRNIEDLVFK